MWTCDQGTHNPLAPTHILSHFIMTELGKHVFAHNCEQVGVLVEATTLTRCDTI